MKHSRPQSQPRRAEHCHSPGRSLARALSKLGYCSRSQAINLIHTGRVFVNDAPEHNPGRPVALQRDRITIDGVRLRPAQPLYLALNKPRGLVTTRADEKGRPTVFGCLTGLEDCTLAPVGRLDMASEGLLLFTNDTAWSNSLLAPDGHIEKAYHVHIDCVADESLCRGLTQGVTDGSTLLRAKQVRVVRPGSSRSWIEIVLEEGRNRHIRRLLEAFGIQTLRLIRVRIGTLQLGSLAKGQWRQLTSEEVLSITQPLARERQGQSSNSSSHTECR